MKQTFSVVASAFVAGALILANPGAALSATEQEIAEALLESSAESLDIVLTDDVLADNLLEDLQYAVEEAVVDPELVETLSGTLDDGIDVDLTENFAENLLEQQVQWSDESGDLKAGLDAVKQDFYECRATSEGPANECARGFGLQIQVALVQQQLQRVEQLQARLGQLTGDELSQAEAELLQVQERLAIRIERAERKVARAEAGGGNAESLKESLGKIGQAPPSSEQRGNSPRSPQNDSLTDDADEPVGNPPANSENDERSNGNAGGEANSNQGGGR